MAVSIDMAIFINKLEIISCDKYEPKPIMDKPALLFYLFIGIFSITAIITLLGITGVIKSIKDKYLNAMFTALVLEVIAAVVLSYKQMDFSCDSDLLLDKFIAKAEANGIDSKDEKVEYILDALAEYGNMKSDYDTMKDQISGLEKQLAECSQELTEVDKSYYMKIIKLRRIIRNEIDGTSINIVFDQDSKKEVFDILEQVFTTLGKVDPNKEPTYKYLTSLYVSFLKLYGIQENLINVNEEGHYTGVYITDYVTSIMIRAYLEKFHSVK